MPLKKYNPVMGDAEKVMRAMKQQYGDEKGKQVFYATKNKRLNESPLKKAIKERLR